MRPRRERSGAIIGREEAIDFLPPGICCLLKDVDVSKNLPVDLLLELPVRGGGQVGIDEPINVTVHDGLDVAHLVAGAVILGQGIGMNT